jgi:hypothetical protein
MTKKMTLPIVGQTLDWLLKPDPGHLVQFYKSEVGLLKPLTKFISAGLSDSDNCIVIATPSHLSSLNALLRESGTDIDAAQKNGQYLILDAAETLSGFMIDDMPDRELFFRTVGSTVEKMSATGRPIRAYGEMVALLWREGNKEAVIRLESLWNELAQTYSFSLFCGYPHLHFVMDGIAQNEITACHNVTLPSFNFG